MLCPGPVDTGFQEAAAMQDVGLFEGAPSPVEVAAVGYKAMEEGQDLVVTPRYLGFLLRKVAPLMPRQALVKASRRTMEKR